jgi:predicted 3-demethylubiquinone-9 3-methyltransferase (glyoxalase superfamily)
MKSVTTFLLFVGEQSGKAEEAINFYTSLFDDSQIINIDYYGAEEHEPEGSVRLAHFSLNGTELMATESSLTHEFTFTPSMSLFIECESMEEIERVHKSLVDGGAELMPLDNYGFSQKFAWVNDRYGVSWQLNLAD